MSLVYVYVFAAKQQRSSQHVLSTRVCPSPVVVNDDEDNAHTHTHHDDELFCDAFSTRGCKVGLR